MVYRLVLIAVIICIFPSCQTSLETTPDEKTVHLVEHFENASITSGKEILKFHDPLVKHKYLGEGWIFKEDNRHKFPWPVLSTEICRLQFNWQRCIDRKMTVKCLNVSPDLPPVLWTLRLNSREIRPLPNNSKCGYYELFLPSAMQNQGVNSIDFKLLPQFSMDPETAPELALSSIEFALGAAIFSPVMISSEIRESLLLAPPISISFPIPSREQVLSFDYGIGISQPRSEVKPASRYDLKVSVVGSKQTKPLQEEIIQIHPAETDHHKWHHIRMNLGNFQRQTLALVFDFKHHPETDPVIDFLALSEIQVHPMAKHNLTVKNDDRPDILLFTMSSIGANALPIYGYPHARTPFLDHLSTLGVTFPDATSASNSTIASLISILTGELPREHGIYDASSQFDKPGNLIPDIFAQEGYRVFSLILADESQFKVFSRFWGFERIYLNNASTEPEADTIEKFRQSLNFRRVGAAPILIWIHLDFSSLKNLSDFRLNSAEDYGHQSSDIEDLNLPHQERKRLIAKAGADNDIRHLFADYDTKTAIIDHYIQSFVYSHYDIRPKRPLDVIITSDHGVYLQENSNLFSNDSLSEEILHVPLFTGTLKKENRIKNRLIPGIIANYDHSQIFPRLAAFDSIRIHLPGPDDDQGLEPRRFFAEHGTRRIVAMRQADYKIIHCLTAPYYRISTTNIFNLEDDPAELLNVISKDPALRSHMLSAVINFTRDGSVYPTPQPGIVEETTDVLKTLNYTN